MHIHIANGSYPNPPCAAIFPAMNLLSTRLDRTSLLAIGVFLAYLLLPYWAA